MTIQDRCCCLHSITASAETSPYRPCRAQKMSSNLLRHESSNLPRRSCALARMRKSTLELARMPEFTPTQMRECANLPLRYNWRECAVAGNRDWTICRRTARIKKDGHILSKLTYFRKRNSDTEFWPIVSLLLNPVAIGLL